jgi:hypothetical protein
VLPRRTAALKIVWFGLVHYERGAVEFTVRRKMEEELSNGPFYFLDGGCMMVNCQTLGRVMFSLLFSERECLFR